MMDSNRSNLYDGLVAGLMTSHSTALGRDLVSIFNLPTNKASVAYFTEPRLVIDGGPRVHYGFPDILAIVRSGGCIFSALIEVKRTARDLLTSRRQYAKYLGCTSAFFIAVPSDLIHIAVSEIRYPISITKYKGIINADSGDIVIIPQVQSFDVSRNLYFLDEALLPKGAAGLTFNFHDIDADSLHQTSDIAEIDGMTVSEVYTPIVLAESRCLYPRDKYYDMYVRWHH